MDSWESTLVVLKDTAAFQTYFARSPNITEPKLLFELNSTGFARKNVMSTIDAGAGVVSDAISDLRRDITDFRKEQTENNNLVQRQVAAIHTNMENQTAAMSLMGNKIHQFGLSLLAGHDEKAIECQISAIDNSLMFESQCCCFAIDPDEISLLRANIAKLQAQRRDLTMKLATAARNTLDLIGPPPGSSFTQPAVLPVVSATAALITQPAPPVVAPSTPSRRPTTTAALSALPVPPAPAALSQPVTPARALSSSPAVSNNPFTHITPVPPLFDLSSISTPTPASRSSATAKRPKPVSSITPETPAKCAKPIERFISTRSETRSSVAAPVGANQVSDLFNEDSDYVVRFIPLPVSIHLITAPADQGELLTGSRPRVAPSLNPTMIRDPSVSVDQLGCVVNPCT
jgi:hypothetical protein